jgi:phage-related holin
LVIVALSVPTRDGDSTTKLASGLIEEAEELVKLEIQLAKQEAKELAITNAVAAGLFAAAGVLAMLAILVAVPVLIVTLVPHHSIAAGVWIAVYVVVAGVLALFGRMKLKIQVPKRTVDSLKETKEWVVQQMRSPGR